LEATSAGEGTGFSAGHEKIARAVIEHGAIGSGQQVLDVGTGTGLLAFTIAAQYGTQVQVTGVDVDEECLARCRRRAAEQRASSLAFLHGTAAALAMDSASMDVVLCRSVLCHILDREPVFREWHRVLKPEGRFSFYEPLDRYETRFSEMVDFGSLGALANRLREAEEAFHRSPASSLMNYDEHDLKRQLEQAGFIRVECAVTERACQYLMTAASARDWWLLDVGGESTPGHPPPCAQLSRYLSSGDLEKCVDFFCRRIAGKTVTFRSKQLYMWGAKQGA
jgi:ubiquinone/menaquinone biosynthesis C-methylase UbiE